MRAIVSNEFRDLLPEHTADELEQLRENCKADPKHKTLPPVLVWEKNKRTHVIIDGHHQHDIRRREGLVTKFVTLHFPDTGAAMRYAIGVQFGRRNLDSTQRAMVYAKLPRFEHGGPRPSKNGEAESSDEQQTPAQERKSDLESLAEQANVSRDTMQKAAKVTDKGAAQLQRAAAAGEVSVNDAAAIVHMPKAEQIKALQKVRSGKVDNLRAAVPKKYKLQRGADFDTKELDKQPAKKQAAKPSGAPEVKREDRVALGKALGVLIRQLDKCGIGDEFAKCTNAMSERVKTI